MDPHNASTKINSFSRFCIETANKSDTTIIIELFLLAIILLVSVITNVTLMVCVLRHSNAKTATGIFICNMTIADILFVLTIPAMAAGDATDLWWLTEISCRIVPYIQLVSGDVILWTMALISVDRHRCVVLPPNKSKISNTCAVFTSAIAWILPAVIFSPVLLHFETFSNMCVFSFPEEPKYYYSFLTLILLAYFLPMITVIYNYQKVFEKILSTKKVWATSCTERRQSDISFTDVFSGWPRKVSVDARRESFSTQEKKRFNKHIKILRHIFLYVATMLAMWLPITLTVLLFFVSESKNISMHQNVFLISLLIAFMNTAINPILYGMLTDGYRDCFKRFFKKIKSINIKEHRTQSSLNSIAELPNEEI